MKWEFVYCFMAFGFAVWATANSAAHADPTGATISMACWAIILQQESIWLRNQK